MEFETVIVIRHGADEDAAREEAQLAFDLLRGHGLDAWRRSTLPSPRPRGAWEAVSGAPPWAEGEAVGPASGDAENGAE